MSKVHNDFRLAILLAAIYWMVPLSTVHDMRAVVLGRIPGTWLAGVLSGLLQPKVCRRRFGDVDMTQEKIRQEASRIASGAVAKFRARYGDIAACPHAMLMATAFGTQIVEDLTNGTIGLPDGPIPEVSMNGGVFDGETASPIPVDRVLNAPNGAFVHYRLCYVFKGYVSKEEAEKMLGMKLQ